MAQMTYKGGMGADTDGVGWGGVVQRLQRGR